MWGAIQDENKILKGELPAEQDIMTKRGNVKFELILSSQNSQTGGGRDSVENIFKQC